MPGDVAVEGPDARVAGVHLHDDVAEGLDHLHVAAHRVRGPHDVRAVVVARAGGEDVHVEAVGVHGVVAGGCQSLWLEWVREEREGREWRLTRVLGCSL